MQSTTTDSRITAAHYTAPGAGRRWGRFLAGVAVILTFAFGVIPALQCLGPVREVREAIDNSGIDATALLYTESEVAGEAESSIRNAIHYAPVGSKLRTCAGVRCR